MQTENSIEGPQGSVHFISAGEGGLPSLFVHSFGGSAMHWINQIYHLQKSRLVIAIDLRGHGKSKLPANGDFSPDGLADDIAAVVDSFNLHQFILVGHSMGGAAAIAYAGKHPERVAGLVLAGTPGKSDPKQAAQIVNSLKSEKYNEVMNDYMNQLLMHAKPEVDIEVRSEFNQLPEKTTIDIIESIFNYDPTPSLQVYEGPVLIIATQHEADGPSSLSKQFPSIREEIVSGTSHWIQLDKPEEFNRILDEFTEQIK